MGPMYIETPYISSPMGPMYIEMSYSWYANMLCIASVHAWFEVV